MNGLPDLRWTPATRDPVGRIVIRSLSNMMPLRPDQRRLCHLFRCQNWIPCMTTTHQAHRSADGRSRRLLNGYLQPKTDAIERVLWYASGLARHQSPPSADSLPRERGIQSARGIHLDSEIDVPDSMFVVTTSCATCGEQFCVTTLESHGTTEYTCPDCSQLRLGTKAKTTSGETGRRLS